MVGLSEPERACRSLAIFEVASFFSHGVALANSQGRKSLESKCAED